MPFPRWQKACDRVSAALLGGEARVVVTGPPGTGKTLLLDHIARVLRASGWTVMLRLADAAPPPNQPGTIALLIDEADRLSRESLQLLLTTTAGPIVLAGLEVLQNRVPGALQIALSPLGREEARDYIAHWLALTGRAPEHLEAAAMRRTVEISGGVPRLASTLLSAAAWLAESSDERIITVEHVEEAAALRSCFVPGDPEVEPVVEPAPERTNTPLLMGMAASMLLLGAGAFVATRYYPAETERVGSTIRQAAAGLQTTISDKLSGGAPMKVAELAPVTPKQTNPPSAPPPAPVVAQRPTPAARVAEAPPRALPAAEPSKAPAPPPVAESPAPTPVAMPIAKIEPPSTPLPPTSTTVEALVTRPEPSAPSPPTPPTPQPAASSEPTTSVTSPTPPAPAPEPAPVASASIAATSPPTPPSPAIATTPAVPAPVAPTNVAPIAPAAPAVVPAIAAPVATPATTAPLVVAAITTPLVPATAALRPPDRSLTPETINLLVRRGAEMMTIGDVSAARLLFGRAAEAGNANAMVEMGRTYDPAVLAQASPLFPTDPAEAARWYRRAIKAGNTAAEDMLQRVDRQRSN